MAGLPKFVVSIYKDHRQRLNRSEHKGRTRSPRIEIKISVPAGIRILAARLNGRNSIDLATSTGQYRNEYSIFASCKISIFVYYRYQFVSYRYQNTVNNKINIQHRSWLKVLIYPLGKNLQFLSNIFQIFFI